MNQVNQIYDAIRLRNFQNLNAQVANLIEQSTGSACERSSGVTELKIQRHPLGFLCMRWELKSGRSLRVHIWDKSSETKQIPYWPIHDHIFSFRSVVLVGVIQNKTYHCVARSSRRRTWELFNVKYEGNSSTLSKVKSGVTLKVTESTLQYAGTYYDMETRILHRSTLRSNFAISVLATEIGCDSLSSPLVVGNGAYENLSFNRTFERPDDTSSVISRGVKLLRDSSQ